jgi:hypothetical protein
MIFLVACGALLALAAPAALDSGAGGGSPARLRLRVKNSSPRAGEATSVWVEFLDRNYDQVQNDGTRVIQFVAAPRGHGSFSPQQVTIGAGEWSAGTTFSGTAPGKVMVSASSEALDSDQTVVLVTREASSFLSQLFETTAYAQQDLFELTPAKVDMSAGDKSRAKFELSWLPAPAAETPIRITTYPPATINYKEQSFEGFAEIRLPPTGKSEEIYVSSKSEMTVSVTATMEGSGRRASAIANFIRPLPEKIVFVDEPQEIPPDLNVIPITVQVADRGLSPVNSDQDRTFYFRKGSDAHQVDFDPPKLVVAANQSVARTWVHWKDMPASGQLTVYAESPGLGFDKKTITIRRQIAGLRITGPSPVTLGRTGADFTVELLDVNDRLVSTDKERTVNLTATSGVFTPNPLIIPSGKNMAKVRYTTSGSAAKAQINATSEGIKSFALEVGLVTALYWLVIFALLGGLIGGVIRHISKNGYRLPRILPCWTGDCWDLGLVGKLAVSIVGGLIMYLLVKFGLYQVMASLPLPEALESGTKLVAFFFGVIGGFAGIYLFDWVLSKLLPGVQQQAASAA